MQQTINFLSSQKFEQGQQGDHVEQLVGDIFTPEASAECRAFLFLHGFPGQPDHDTARVMAEHGYPSMTYHMAGHPPSEGDINEITIARSLKDAEKAYDALRDHVGKTAVIGVAGSSFGAYLATMLPRLREDIDCLSLRAPANYPDDLFEAPLNPVLSDQNLNRELREWRERNGELQQGDNFALDALRAFRGRVQIIRAGKDRNIPEATVETYANVVSSGLLEFGVMEHAPHGLETEALSEEYIGMLLRWAGRLPEA
jgi:pimeloyl-ACP methyl ester carboxylesterase